ncbi:Piso0_003190 [Millerozyma farinosa CBS 7064]|uniref:Piso0_003190 protein n=1 Tax=Pichia sorbitophila (strain ATCC MYA-4447 / BCRC 22081 / CBS 7064 / NBRC 10061 / NRRL Y-12695) TaxID=559304 RepID=G8YHF5_PICSO|nr:Piso0_003190 [Millerozyma farinosa CBS 7064]CCE80857.1 Piso0_003190 [Millerozyma farinosa CBS 7064]
MVGRSWKQNNVLTSLDRACRPSLSEPNLALNLEICDYVNAKQGSAPREAAIAVVKLINQNEPQTSELALSLLDNLVKNCGYPFHLQISRKEFLNELVKKFPERTPMRYSRVQRLILAQIEEWYQTICKTSKYKEDFGYIRDMHRLLSSKGYIFPEVKLEDAAVLNPSDNLKSLDEIQKEESIVHSAKLQELIRRGKPRDLQEANKLMKIMAGFKDDNVEENKKQVTDHIARLKRKAEILGEMLNSIQSNNGSIDSSNEAVNELYASVKSSQPIINKIIEEEREDESKVKELLELNDSCNHLIEKFQLLKSGHVDEASKIAVKGSTGTTSDSLNLIDFDDEGPISNDTSGKDDKGYKDLLSELSNLSFTAPTSSNATNNQTNFFGTGGSISLGENKAQQPNIVSPNPHVASSSGQGVDLLGDFNSPSPQLQLNTSTQGNAQLDPFSLNFPSSTPNQVQAANGVTSSTVISESNKLKFTLSVLSDSKKERFHGRVSFSNRQAAPLSNFKFYVAAPKSCKLTLSPQSGEVLYGFADNGVTQDFVIENPENKPLKAKWKIEYNLAGQTEQETGISQLDI